MRLGSVLSCAGTVSHRRNAYLLADWSLFCAGVLFTALRVPSESAILYETLEAVQYRCVKYSVLVTSHVYPAD